MGLTHKDLKMSWLGYKWFQIKVLFASIVIGKKGREDCSRKAHEFVKYLQLHLLKRAMSGDTVEQMVESVDYSECPPGSVEHVKRGACVLAELIHDRVSRLGA